MTIQHMAREEVEISAKFGIFTISKCSRAPASVSIQEIY